VNARLHGMSTGETQRVTNINDCGAWFGSDEAEFLGSWWSDLETPLLAEEESERADIGVLLVADVLLGYRVARDVVHHCQGAGGWAVVSVRVLESGGAAETEAGGET